MNDEKIIELYFARSEDAIAETDRKYGGVCRKTAFGILGDSGDSEECVSDTYMKVWSVIPPQRPVKLGAFVVRIVRNLALDMRRKQKTLKSGEGFGCVPLDEIAGCLPSRETTESQADEREVLKAVETFLRELPKNKRVMFVRRYFYCRTCADIADELHTTEGKVTMTLYRIREKLRKYLEKEGIDI